MFNDTQTDASAISLVNARNEIFWLDDPGRPAALPPLETHTTADLCVVGAGFSGLWTAILAKEEHPEWSAVATTVEIMPI